MLGVLITFQRNILGTTFLDVFNLIYKPRGFITCYIFVAKILKKFTAVDNFDNGNRTWGKESLKIKLIEL